MGTTLVLTGGGTAGHVTPLLAVASQLHLSHPEAHLVYVGQHGDKNEQLVLDSGLPITVEHVYAGKFRRYHGISLWAWLTDVRTNLMNLGDLFLITLGFFQSIALMFKYRPAAVFTKGSFAAVPVCFAAALWRTPILTHDSDTLPGLSNRLVAPFATKHAVALAADYPYAANKVVVTGVPIAKAFYEANKLGLDDAKRSIGLPKQSSLLLITGGSQGATRLDDLVEQAAGELLSAHPVLYIVHVFGRLNEQFIAERYAAISPKLQQRIIKLGFTSDIHRYVAAADIIIGRAGATFLAEFGVLKKACVIIPAGQLTGGHQLKNAALLEARKAIKVVREGDDTAVQQIVTTVKELLDDPTARRKLGEALFSTTNPNAAATIAELIWEIAKK